MRKSFDNVFPGICVGILALVLYGRTLAPSLTWAHDGVDGGDLTTATVVGGIAHPPGYPLYLFLARFLLLIPFGDFAYRLNWMSAFWGAASVLLLVIAIRLTSLQTKLAVCVAALLFALCPIQWDQSVITEVYSLHTFLSGLSITLMAVWVLRHPRSRVLFFCLGLVLGLAAGNHLTVLLLLPALAFALWQNPHAHKQGIVLSFVGLFAGLAIYLYLPYLAARDPALAWGNATTWSGFWWLISAAPYRQFAFALPLQYVPQRGLALGQLWIQQFNLIGVGLGLWGWVQLRQRQPRLVWPLTLAALAEIIYAWLYNTTDSYVYLLPALWIFAIWIAWGLADLFARIERAPIKWRSFNISRVFLLASFLLPIWSLGHYAKADLSQDHVAVEYGRGVLQRAAPNAIIVADTDAHIFTLWYYRLALGERPDVTIVAVPLYQYAWYRQQLARHDQSLRGTEQILLNAFLAANRGQRPINLTDPNPGFNVLGNWRWDGWLAHLE